MAIEPVKIPQNVYIEDRIVGPLTLRQIIISMLGIGFSYAIWASIAKVQGTVPIPVTVIVWIPGVLSVVFAFVKINDLSMAHLILLFVERINKPQTRIYGPRRGLTVNARSFAPPNPNARRVAAKPQPGEEIDSLSALLDHEGLHPPHMAEPAEPETIEADEPNAPERQGSSIPTRPVDKNRVKVSPLLQADIADLETVDGKQLFRDVFHPPASHA